MKRLVASITLMSATLAYAGTDYYYVSQPINNIIGKTIFNATHYPAENFNKPIWSVDNSTGSIDGSPANFSGETVSTWNLGDFTGTNVPAPLQNYQRGRPGASYGGTAVSMHDELDGGALSAKFGAMLNAYSLPWAPNLTDESGNSYLNPRNIMGANLQYAFSGDINHKPFSRGPSSKFHFSMMLQVPSVAAEGNIRAHAGLSFTLQDTTDPEGRYIWFAPWAFDYPSGNNGPAPLESISNDVASVAYIIGSSFSPNTTYATMEPGSATSTNQPWNGWRWYAISVSYAQMQKALSDLNSVIANAVICKTPSSDPLIIRKCTPLSGNPSDYKLGMLHLDSEIARTGPNGGGYMGLSTYGWWAYSTY